MFKKISYTLALQFTSFVFLLFLLNGAVFLVADFQNARHQSSMRLGRTLQYIVTEWNGDVTLLPEALPAMIRERIRVLDEKGRPIYSGGFFSGVAFSGREGLSRLTLEGEQYGVLTAPVLGPEGVRGYVQVADIERFQRGDIPMRSYLYLLVSIAVSALTFGVGLFFARRSLKPAQSMMERLEQFTQDASHELRTPLAAMNSSLDLALRTKKYQAGIVSAKEDLRHVATLVERLLELARLDRFVLLREVVDLSSLVTEAVEKHALLATEKNVTFVPDIRAGVTVSGDPALLRQLLGNLFANAIKFAKPQGGNVRITLTSSALIVEDEGIGIDEQVLPNIFERFYQADGSRAQGGFGLGLALVKRIVDLHHWSIVAKSRKEKGTTFLVSFASRTKKTS